MKEKTYHAPPARNVAFTWKKRAEGEEEEKLPLLILKERKTKNPYGKLQANRSIKHPPGSSRSPWYEWHSQVLPLNPPGTLVPCLPSPSRVRQLPPVPRRQTIRNRQNRRVIHTTPFIRLTLVLLFCCKRKEEKQIKWKSQSISSARKKSRQRKSTFERAAPVAGTSSIRGHVLLPSRPGVLFPCLCRLLPALAHRSFPSTPPVAPPPSIALVGGTSCHLVAPPTPIPLTLLPTVDARRCVLINWLHWLRQMPVYSSCTFLLHRFPSFPCISIYLRLYLYLPFCYFAFLLSCYYILLIFVLLPSFSLSLVYQVLLYVVVFAHLVFCVAEYVCLSFRSGSIFPSNNSILFSGDIFIFHVFLISFSNNTYQVVYIIREI